MTSLDLSHDSLSAEDLDAQIEALLFKAKRLPSRKQRQLNRILKGLPPTLQQWCKRVWPRWNWDWRHLVLLCEYLEQILNGEIKRLIIMMPIRHGKSELVSSRFPVYALHDDATRRIILGSYGKELAVKFGRNARRFGEMTGLHMREDRNAAHDWETVEGGGMRAVGVGVGVAGHGGDIIIVDDPCKSREEAESETYRQKVFDWYTDDLYSRLEPNAAMIIMAARWHENDLIGRLLDPEREDAEDWTVLKLPGEAEKDDILGREEGEALCPDRYPKDVLNKMHVVMGDYGYSGLVQQSPIPKGGMMFPRDRVEIIDAIPATACKRLRYWDKAGSTPDDNGKFTVGVKMSYVPLDEQWGSGYVIVEDVVRGQWESEVRDREMKRVAQMERFVKQIHEQEPGSGGKQSAEITTKQFGAAGSATEADKVTGDKIIRADPFASQWRAGNVKLLRGEWNKGYLDRMEKFPNGTYIDEGDASGGAFNKIMLGVNPNIRSLS